MKDLTNSWSETRMVVLAAISAAIYAATVIPLKIATIIPGFTEVRPGVSFVVFCSLMFGPAGAWGAALGNLIADFFGTLTLGSVFGFFGNLFFGYTAYRIYDILCKEPPFMTRRRHWVAVFTTVILSSLVCGVTIGWGVDLIGGAPFQVLALIIFLNNGVMGLILVPILLVSLSRRVKHWGMYYKDIFPSTAGTRRLAVPGLILTVAGAAGALVAGLLQGNGLITLPFPMAGILSPFILAMVLGIAIL